MLDSKISRERAEQSQPPSPCELPKSTLGWLNGSIGYNSLNDITELNFTIAHPDISNIKIHESQKNRIKLKIESQNNNQYSVVPLHRQK